jgi:hypothetical protein
MLTDLQDKREKRWNVLQCAQAMWSENGIGPSALTGASMDCRKDACPHAVILVLDGKVYISTHNIMPCHKSGIP